MRQSIAGFEAGMRLYLRKEAASEEAEKPETPIEDS